MLLVAVMMAGLCTHAVAHPQARPLVIAPEEAPVAEKTVAFTDKFKPNGECDRKELAVSCGRLTTLGAISDQSTCTYETQLQVMNEVQGYSKATAAYTASDGTLVPVNQCPGPLPSVDNRLTRLSRPQLLPSWIACVLTNNSLTNEPANAAYGQKRIDYAAQDLKEGKLTGEKMAQFCWHHAARCQLYYDPAPGCGKEMDAATARYTVEHPLPSGAGKPKSGVSDTPYTFYMSQCNFVGDPNYPRHFFSTLTTQQQQCILSETSFIKAQWIFAGWLNADHMPQFNYRISRDDLCQRHLQNCVKNPDYAPLSAGCTKTKDSCRAAMRHLYIMLFKQDDSEQQCNKCVRPHRDRVPRVALSAEARPAVRPPPCALPRVWLHDVGRCR